MQCLTDRLRTIAQNTVEGFIDSRVSPSVAKTRDAAPSISLCGNGLREEGEQVTYCMGISFVSIIYIFNVDIKNLKSRNLLIYFITV